MTRRPNAYAARIPPPRAKTLVQQKGDFTAEGAPLPGQVGTALPETRETPAPASTPTPARRSAATPRAPR